MEIRNLDKIDEFDCIKDDEDKRIEYALTCMLDRVDNVIGSTEDIPDNLRQGQKEVLVSQLDEKIVGQDEAKKAFIDTIFNLNREDCNRKGILGSLLFLGPSGVGKTELVKVFGELMLGNEAFIKKINCENYTESHTAMNLFGSPKSYVGYGDPPELADINLHVPYYYAKEKECIHPLIKGLKKFCIILFDEIEKAHPVVIKSLLGAMNDGFIELNSGQPNDPKTNYSKITDLSNAIFVFTSNIGADIVKDQLNTRQIGFGNKAPVDRSGIYEKALIKYFPTEFIGRLNNTITFDRLTEKDAEKIIDIEVNKINESLSATLFKFQITPNAKKLIVEKGFDQEYGARRLNQYINKTVGGVLSGVTRYIDSLNEKAVRLGSMFEIICYRKEGELAYKFKKKDVPLLLTE